MRREMKSKDEGEVEVEVEIEEPSHDGAAIRNDGNSIEVETVTITEEEPAEEEVDEESTDADAIENNSEAADAIDATSTTPSCTICDDEPSPYMAMTGKSCPDVYLQEKCGNDPTSNWQENKYCTQTCYDLGIGYDGIECCDPSSLPAATLSPTGMPTLSPSLSPTSEEPTASPSASPVSDPPTSSPTPEPSTASPTDVPSLPPTTKEPSAGPTAAPSTASPSGLPTQESTSPEPTASPTVTSSSSPSAATTSVSTSGSPTASPTILVTTSTEAQPDVVGEDRIVDLLHSSKSASSDDELVQSSKSKEHLHTKKSNSGDEIQSIGSNNVPKYQFSPGCASIRRGEIYTKGEQITIAFKYMVLYDGDSDLSHLLVGLEDNLQIYAEQSMINCPGASSYVVNNGATWIDGVQIDLPSQPEAGCGVDENNQTCSMLDGYVTIYMRETAEISGLTATQDALKALRVGMADGLVKDTDGISKLSFLGGISVEGDGLGHGTPDNIPASARIGSAPLGNMPEEGSGLSAVGIGLLVVAAIGVVLVGAALRRRVRFRLKKRALADSDSDADASLDNDVRSFDAADRGGGEIEQRDSTMGQSFAESLASCHGDTPAACGAQDSSDDESIAQDKLMRVNTASFDGGMQTIAIHQYCEAPTCTICRSYKKPMFANMKYKVEEKSAPMTSDAAGEADSVRDDVEVRDDCGIRRYEACPTTGIVAKTFAKLSSSGSDCYLCA